MTYELCKQLKEAGYLQNKHGTGIWYADNGDISPEMLRSGGVVKLDDLYYCPNLPELIQVCSFGELPFALIYKYSVRTGWIWEARKGLDEDFKELISSEGKTPSEAVAKLWLALNKKGNK